MSACKFKELAIVHIYTICRVHTLPQTKGFICDTMVDGYIFIARKIQNGISTNSMKMKNYSTE
jgi:hypothetical protein